MGEARFNTNLISVLRDILLRLHYGKSLEDVHEDFHRHFEQIDAVEILLIVYELKNGDDGITSRDVMRLFSAYSQVFGRSIHELHVSAGNVPGHPVQTFQAENNALRCVLDDINALFAMIDSNEQCLQEGLLEKLQDGMSRLGQFISHYNRKEKLFFAILERYGHFTLTRIMWGDDDRIRNLYKGTKSMMEKIPDLDFKYIKKSYDLFERRFKEMIFEEETILLPVVVSVFDEDDWVAIAEESDAFGYAIIEPIEWEYEREMLIDEDQQDDEVAGTEESRLPFGGGFLSINEANAILNNLPVEITFVNKYGVFQYFNEMVQASEMMFVRTPSSIGRNIANCHPPKSMTKVMRLMRDLHQKRRSSESMWFKKDGRYIHITYKGLFDENGDYLGILEYVQDIQPFFDLPREVKKEIQKAD